MQPQIRPKAINALGIISKIKVPYRIERVVFIWWKFSIVELYRLNQARVQLTV